MANQAPQDPQHPERGAPANAPIRCADCGASLEAISVEMRGSVLCMRCAAVHALVDPKASAREARHASFVLALAAALLEDERLSHLAGLGPVPAKERS